MTIPRSLPRLAVTMGDPAGIGPEVCLKTLSDADLPAYPILIGDLRVLRETAERIGLNTALVRITSTGDGNAGGAAIPVIAVGNGETEYPMGEIDARAGRLAYRCIRAAIGLARAGGVDGVVTAPINKESLAAAAIPFPGHTEILSRYGGGSETAMMLATPELRVVLVTVHCSLRDAISRITQESVLRAIRHAHQAAVDEGVEAPRVAVAGLNPHAGEGGLFGDDEREVIEPAVRLARAGGIDASGPWPGDTVFMQAREGRFDIVVAQYHDQGLIPIKYQGLAHGVNVTLGLPFVRTSPDHGTAFDIAGRGIADPTSLLNAFNYAARLSIARRRAS